MNKLAKLISEISENIQNEQAEVEIGETQLRNPNVYDINYIQVNEITTTSSTSIDLSSPYEEANWSIRDEDICWNMESAIDKETDRTDDSFASFNGENRILRKRRSKNWEDLDYSTDEDEISEDTEDIKLEHEEQTKLAGDFEDPVEVRRLMLKRLHVFQKRITDLLSKIEEMEKMDID